MYVNNTNMHTCVYAHKHTGVYTHIYMCMHVCAYICMCVSVFTYIHMYKHTHYWYNSSNKLLWKMYKRRCHVGSHLSRETLKTFILSSMRLFLFCILESLCILFWNFMVFFSSWLFYFLLLFLFFTLSHLWYPFFS
jgi:hypothetical protein